LRIGPSTNALLVAKAETRCRGALVAARAMAAARGLAIDGDEIPAGPTKLRPTQ
jgi:hypothetical protein